MSETKERGAGAASAGAVLGPAPAPGEHTDVEAVLTCVRELLAEKRRWTKNTSARDAARRTVGPRSVHATKFCLLGAIERCCVDRTVHDEAVGLLRGEIGGQTVAGFNDAVSTRHEDVLAALDGAIQAATRTPRPARASTKRRNDG